MDDVVVEREESHLCGKRWVDDPAEVGAPHLTTCPHPYPGSGPAPLLIQPGTFSDPVGWDAAVSSRFHVVQISLSTWSAVPTGFMGREVTTVV